MSPIDTSPDSITVSPSRLLTDGGVDEKRQPPEDSQSAYHPSTQDVAVDSSQLETDSETSHEQREPSAEVTGTDGQKDEEIDVEAQQGLKAHRIISLEELGPTLGLAQRVRRESSILIDAYEAQEDQTLDIRYPAYSVGIGQELHIIPADENPLFAVVDTSEEEIIVSEYKAFDKVRSSAQLNQFVPKWAVRLTPDETEAARKALESAFADAVQDYDEGNIQSYIVPSAASFLKQQTDSVRLIVPTGIEADDAEYEVTFKPDPRRNIGESGSVRFDVAFANDPSARVIADVYSNRLSGMLRGFEADWAAEWLFDYWDEMAQEETVENEQEQALIELFLSQMSNLKIGPLTEHVATEWWKPNNTRGIYIEPDDGVPYVVVGGQYIKNFVDQHRHEVRRSISDLLFQDGVLVERPGNRTSANKLLCAEGLDAEPSVWMVCASRLDFDPESLSEDERDWSGDGELSPNVSV
jgi:hypothetical protein